MHKLIKKYFEENITPDEKRQLFTLVEVNAGLKKEFMHYQNQHALSSFIIDEDDEINILSKLSQFKLKQKKRIVK